MMLTDHHGERFEKVGLSILLHLKNIGKIHTLLTISKLIMLNLYGAGRLLSRIPKN